MLASRTWSNTRTRVSAYLVYLLVVQVFTIGNVLSAHGMVHITKTWLVIRFVIEGDLVGLRSWEAGEALNVDRERGC